MPLIHSKSKAAFSRNVATEMRHGRPQDQALAIAYRIKRERRAKGGKAAATPRAIYRKPGTAPGSVVHAGPIASPVPGRTDNHGMAVAPGSYVLPADHVSSLGQGNTEAGMSVLGHMFGPDGPYGLGKAPAIRKGAGVPKPPSLRTRADGGAVDDDPVDIMAAGGEFVIPPEIVAQIGSGDVDRGHKILDAWIVGARRKHISTLKKLPGPAKS